MTARTSEDNTCVSTAAVASLLMEAQRPLYTFVRGMVGDEELARDLVQDVFMDALRATKARKPPFSAAPDPDAIRRWLFHAAYCDAASALRRHRVIRWESLDVYSQACVLPPHAPLPVEDQVIESVIVRAALASLHPDEAACLLLNAIQGFTAVEIAEIVGISPEAGKKRLSRAKQRLRAAYYAESAET